MSTMQTTHYLALLRGINVGGNNIIKMADSKACFERMGFSNVTTYIQSGNVLFSSEEKNIETLIAQIEKALTKKFNYTSRVLVLSGDMLKEVVDEAPKEFGKNPDTYRYDVIFIKAPLTPPQAIKEIETKEGVDEVHRGTHALYFSRTISKAGQSYLPKVIKLPIYKSMSVRNWNTTTKLLSIMEK